MPFDYGAPNTLAGGLYQLGQSFPFLKFIGGPVRAGSEDAANAARERAALAAWQKANPNVSATTLGLTEGQQQVGAGQNFMDLSGGLNPQGYNSMMLPKQIEAENERHRQSLAEAERRGTALRDYQRGELSNQRAHMASTAAQNIGFYPEGPAKQQQIQLYNQMFPEYPYPMGGPAAGPPRLPPIPTGPAESRASGAVSPGGLPYSEAPVAWLADSMETAARPSSYLNPAQAFRNGTLVAGAATSNMHPVDWLSKVAAQGQPARSPGALSGAPQIDPTSFLQALIQFLTQKGPRNANLPK